MSSRSRQPVHTVYGGAHLFQAMTAQKLARMAEQHLVLHAPSAAALAAACELPEAVALPVYTRVLRKLQKTAVEDYRLDFEDGYGYRPEAEEDGHAVSAAYALAQGMRDGTLPPWVGIRIKGLAPQTQARGLRTLHLFVDAYARTGAALPQPFLVTLPKVTTAQEVACLAAELHEAEIRLKWPSNCLGMELMIETPQALLDAAGTVPLRRWVDAARGRCVAAHLGAYDYTAACEVTAAHQSLRHPACVHARQIMQLALSGTGVAWVDGATTSMPIAPHRGEGLSAALQAENQAVVHAAWRAHAQNVRQALIEGYYQGWDLHPAQLAARYAALYGFFLESLPAASARLQAFLGRAAQASRVGAVFDDAASGQGLLNFFLRGLGCGALEPGDLASAGLTAAELQTRSFQQIVEGRRALPPQREP